MLEGKVAIVTGSTSGIGLGIACSLASVGADVMLNGLGDAAQVEAARRAVLEAGGGGRVAYSDADLSRPEQVRGLVERTIGELGGVDVLVNNGGIQHTAPVESFPPERWDAVIAINLGAAFHAIAAALPRMRERGWGRIVNVASVHGLVGSEHKCAYVAAKHGVIGLTKVVALETATTAITCNAICPGWVLTPLVQRQIDALAQRDGLQPEAAAHALLAEKQPSLQFATPQQIGTLVVFLASEAAAQIRGAALPVDGAWLAR
jgi:3-hydroxybutyrate dehydrogenase